MIQIADNVVNELLRHIPLIIEILPKPLPKDNLRAINALRKTKINMDKLRVAKDKQRKTAN